MRSFKSLRETYLGTNTVQTDDVPSDPMGYVEIKPAKKSKITVKEKSISETKSAPKGFHFTKDGKLKRGDADTDGDGGSMLRADPLDKQRSKVPPVSEESVLDESDLQTQMAAFAASRGGKMTTSAERKQTTADMMAKREKEAASRPEAEPQKTTPYKPLGGRDEKSGRSYSEGVDLDEEQIDELSNTTLKSYNKKAVSQIRSGEVKDDKALKRDDGAARAQARIFKTSKAPRAYTEESELGDLAHEKTMKHRFLVTYSDPNHTMVFKRKEKQQKHVLVPSTHKGQTVYQGEAEPLAKKYMKKQGYKVHEIEHVGMVTKKVNEAADTKPGFMLRQDPALAKKIDDAKKLAKKRQASYGDPSKGISAVKESIDLNKVWESIRTPSLEDEIEFEALDEATLKLESDKMMADEIKAHKALMRSE